MPTESSTIRACEGPFARLEPTVGRGATGSTSADDVGKRCRREIGGFRTKKEAQDALDDSLSGVQSGTFVALSRTTVRDFLELWLEGLETDVGLTAWMSYRRAVRQHYLNPHLRSRRVGELSVLDVKRWHGCS